MNYKILIFLLSILTFAIACKDTNSSGSEETANQEADSLMQKNNHTKNAPRSIQIYTWVNKLRMRAEPDTKADIIAELAEGEALTYLDEKTDFTQKITIRGSIQDEPWLKVQTQSGKIGWVYGGGVKFYRPRVDVAPSPYSACFQKLAKDRRYSAFTTCVERIAKKQAKKDSRYIQVQDNGLTITLLSGRKKVLNWSPSGQGDPIGGYFYRYYLPQMGFFVVEKRGSEAPGYLLINDKSGKEIPLHGFPKAAPNFKHLAVASTDVLPEIDAFGFQIYGFTEDGFQAVWERTFPEEQVILTQWLEPTKLAITLRPISTQTGARVRIVELERQSDGTWILIEEEA